MSSTFTDFIGLMFYAAVIYLLVRPGSSGASAITTITGAAASLIAAATAE